MERLGKKNKRTSWLEAGCLCSIAKVQCPDRGAEAWVLVVNRIPREGHMDAKVDLAKQPAVTNHAKPLKIVIAIHGIGDQVRSSTVRSVARQFGERYEPPLPVMPLGYFDVAGAAQVGVTKLDLPAA